MPADRRPVFTSDWSRYAIAAHVIFWLTSAVFLASWVGAIAGLTRAESAFFMFVLWLASCTIVGGSALFSGRLYVGNQVLSRQPTTGWSARAFGAFLLLGAAAILWFGYAILNVTH